MNLYHAYYKRQYFDKETKCWMDTYYTCQGIVVLADCYESAKIKVEECITKAERGNFRAVLVSDVEECLGLDIRHAFEDSLDINPIF